MTGHRQSLVADEEDQVQRLARFRAAYPRLIILAKAAVPEAYPHLGEPPVRDPMLKGLLDKLGDLLGEPEAGQ